MPSIEMVAAADLQRIDLEQLRLPKPAPRATKWRPPPTFLRCFLQERTALPAVVLHSVKWMILADVLLLIGVAMVVYYSLILARSARRDER